MKSSIKAKTPENAQLANLSTFGSGNDATALEDISGVSQSMPMVLL